VNVIEGIGRVATIEQAMAVLEALSGQPEGVAITELERILGLSKSALSRILATLQRDRYVSKDLATGRFKLAHKFLALVLRHIDTLGIDELCGPILRKVAAQSGELVELALVEHEEMRYIARAEGRHRVRVISPLGIDIPLHAYAAGKVWLAHLPQEDALRIALESGLEKLTKNTIATIEALQKELALIRKQAFALNLEESDEGISSVAVPIFAGGKRSVVGALTLAGPVYRLPKSKLITFVRELQKAALELSQVLPNSPILN
jgi:DNA-binding IclR family transcriptional regulator